MKIMTQIQKPRCMLRNFGDVQTSRKVLKKEFCKYACARPLLCCNQLYVVVFLIAESLFWCFYRACVPQFTLLLNVRKTSLIKSNAMADNQKTLYPFFTPLLITFSGSLAIELLSRPPKIIWYEQLFMSFWFVKLSFSW